MLLTVLALSVVKHGRSRTHSLAEGQGNFVRALAETQGF